VTLIARWDEIARRHSERPENQRADIERVVSVYTRIITSQDKVGGMWIETDQVSPVEIAQAISGSYVEQEFGSGDE